MAFTWEVEALRKLVEGIIADTASEYNKAADQLGFATQPPWAEDTGGKYGIDEPGFVSAEKEKKVREQLELDPDDPLPDHYEIDRWGNVWDLTIQDELERRALAEMVDDSPLTEQEIEESNAAADAERYGLGYKEKDKLKLDWLNEILKEFPEDKAPEVIRLPQWTTPLPDHLKDEEERPDLTPFASYLRFLPPPVAAGLLGIGSMLYSKPAY